MNHFTIPTDLDALIPCLASPAISRIAGSLPRSIQPCSHSTLETRDAAPNISSPWTYTSQTAVLPTSPLYSPSPLKPNISAQSILPCVYDPPEHSAPVSPDAPFILPGDRSAAGNTLLHLPSGFDTGIPDKIQDGTCIRKSYDLISYTYSSCTSLSLGAPFREVQIINFLQPSQRYNHAVGPLPKAVDLYID